MTNNEYEQYSSREFLALEDSASFDELEGELSKLNFKGVVVDIGCGYGNYLQFIPSKIEKYIGIEPNDFLRKLAKQKASNLSFKTRFMKGRFEKIPLKDSSADVVMTTYALNELRDLKQIKKAISEIHRITKPGGMLVVCDLSGGINDEYYNLLNTVEVVRGNRPLRNIADVWIEVFLFIQKNAVLERAKRVRFCYEFKDKDDAIEKTKAIIPDISTNQKIAQAVRKFYAKPRLLAEGLLVVARFH